MSEPLSPEQEAKRARFSLKPPLHELTDDDWEDLFAALPTDPDNDFLHGYEDFRAGEHLGFGPGEELSTEGLGDVEGALRVEGFVHFLDWMFDDGPVVEGPTGKWRAQPNVVCTGIGRLSQPWRTTLLAANRSFVEGRDSVATRSRAARHLELLVDAATGSRSQLTAEQTASLCGFVNFPPHGDTTALEEGDWLDVSIRLAGMPNEMQERLLADMSKAAKSHQQGLRLLEDPDWADLFALVDAGGFEALRAVYEELQTSGSCAIGRAVDAAGAQQESEYAQAELDLYVAGFVHTFDGSDDELVLVRRFCPGWRQTIAAVRAAHVNDPPVKLGKFLRKAGDRFVGTSLASGSGLAVCPNYSETVAHQACDRWIADGYRPRRTRFDYWATACTSMDHLAPEDHPAAVALLQAGISIDDLVAMVAASR